MDFIHMLPMHKKAEEDALFDLARRIYPENLDGFSGNGAFVKWVAPLLAEQRAHPDATDNFVAFAILGTYLMPSAGLGRFLPQCAPEWLAFRRLYLGICDLEIPESLLRQRSDGSETEEDQFLDSESYEYWDASELQQERSTPSSAEEESLDGNLAGLKQVVAARLTNYEGVSLRQMKDDFVENLSMEVDQECGALYELKHNVPWKLNPEILDFDTAAGESSTARRLSRITNSAGMNLDFAGTYHEAALSVRGVLFDLSFESTFGQTLHFDTPIRDLEKAFYMRLLISDPMSIESEVIRNFLIDGLSGEGRGSFTCGRDRANFARGIASTIEAAEKKEELSHHENIKKIVTTYWLNPEIPLWLMTVPAIESFLRVLGITRSPSGLKGVIKELKKSRKGSDKSPLVGIRNGLITGVELKDGDSSTGILEMSLQDKMKSDSPIFAKLVGPLES